MGIPDRLRAVGVAPEALQEIAEHTMDDWLLTLLPTPVGRADLLDLLHAAW